MWGLKEGHSGIKRDENFLDRLLMPWANRQQHSRGPEGKFMLQHQRQQQEEGFEEDHTSLEAVRFLSASEEGRLPAVLVQALRRGRDREGCVTTSRHSETHSPGWEV